MYMHFLNYGFFKSFVQSLPVLLLPEHFLLQIHNAQYSVISLKSIRDMHSYSQQVLSMFLTLFMCYSSNGKIIDNYEIADEENV